MFSNKLKASVKNILDPQKPKTETTKTVQREI